MASLLAILLVIALVGLVVWLILQLPIPPLFKNLIIGVAAIFVVLWLISLLLGGGPIHLPRLG